jgi:hypothetical protein
MSLGCGLRPHCEVVRSPTNRPRRHDRAGRIDLPVQRRYENSMGIELNELQGRAAALRERLAAFGRYL